MWSRHTFLKRVAAAALAAAPAAALGKWAFAGEPAAAFASLDGLDGLTFREAMKRALDPRGPTRRQEKGTF